MITHLNGKVVKVEGNSTVIDVNGVGYSIICSARTADELRNNPGEVHLFTVLNVREDSWTLYGFVSEKERFWFNSLVSVQGVGGKVAVAILSVLSDEDMYNAFLAGDKDAFTGADGVGPKLAARIISELKDKIIGKAELIGSAAAARIPESAVVSDVISAVSNLGYNKADVLRAISSLQPKADEAFDILLKRVLVKISSGV
ncbi:MAG: Holliday junction branch migration protein RuvA [Holosporaceae bacterium]|jgi:Holliday junction DNA helicase RuvA|nr:Holliday junction branch migration protein RuvA [Holosporaceae bacterium]